MDLLSLSSRDIFWSCWNNCNEEDPFVKEEVVVLRHQAPRLIESIMNSLQHRCQGGITVRTRACCCCRQQWNRTVAKLNFKEKKGRQTISIHRCSPATLKTSNTFPVLIDTTRQYEGIVRKVRTIQRQEVFHELYQDDKNEAGSKTTTKQNTSK